MNVRRRLQGTLRKRFWTNTRWTTTKEELTEAEDLCRNGGACGKKGSTEYESGEKMVGQGFFALFMKRQQRMKIMKDMTKKIRSKGRRDTDNIW